MSERERGDRWSDTGIDKSDIKKRKRAEERADETEREGEGDNIEE